MAPSQRDSTADMRERLLEACREAAAEALRWRDDPERAAALKAARLRLRRPAALPPRTPERILADELRAARAAFDRAAEGDRAAAYANLKRWEPGLFGYSETQRSTAGRIAAAEAAAAARDARERAEAHALIQQFRAAQERVRAAVSPGKASPRKASPLEEPS